ncbi:MAG TPA: YbfB/YjiJ family MFS transporter, partial [Abditibacterium sp.]
MISTPTVEPAAPTRAQTLILAACLALVPAVAIGFGRFAYGLVLPAMRSDLGWSYAQSGALNTANAVGYLMGALATAPLARRVSSRGLLLGGLAVSILALLLAGLTRSFALLLVCRFLVGLSAAFANITATSLAAKLGRDAHENALALGLVISGPSLGVLFSGAALPSLLAGHDARWPLAWQILAGVGFLTFFGALWGTKSLDVPHSPSQIDASGEETPANLRVLWPTLAAYFGFGLGYIAYMTFLIAYVRAMGASPAMVSLTWLTLGVGMLASTFVWRGRMARELGGGTLALMGLCGASSALVLLFSSALPALLLSALGFGVTTSAVFTAVTIAIRRHLSRPHWT